MIMKFRKYAASTLTSLALIVSSSATSAIEDEEGFAYSEIAFYCKPEMIIRTQTNETAKSVWLSYSNAMADIGFYFSGDKGKGVWRLKKENEFTSEIREAQESECNELELLLQENKSLILDSPSKK